MYTTSLFVLLGVGLVAGLPQQGSQFVEDFLCPEPEGIFEDEYQCDKYWTCKDDFATASICDDGLVFDIFKANAGTADPCESPYVVDCGFRDLLQEPTFPNQYCPRSNGIFADPNPGVCDKFYTCVKGHPNPTTCSNGLHFDEKSANCVWPATAQRQNCSTEVKDCLGEFCCTGKKQLSADGVELPHPTYANFEDCQKFYVCLDGVKPQESSCGLGEVYNERTMLCDYPQNVPECEGWYRDHPQFADYYDYDVAPASKKGPSIGNANARPGT